jgi:colicin import membrane protein
VGWKLIVAVAAGLASTAPVIAIAEEKPTAPTAVSAKDLTREQFHALPADAVIEINGESITKSAFQARNIKAVEEAAKRLPELRARARAQSDARRKALLEKRAAELAEANKKAEAEIARLVDADTAKHGPNWAARKKQAAELLEQAAKASPTERSELEKQADELLMRSAK